MKKAEPIWFSLNPERPEIHKLLKLLNLLVFLLFVPCMKWQYTKNEEGERDV